MNPDQVGCANGMQAGAAGGAQLHKSSRKSYLLIRVWARPRSRQVSFSEVVGAIDEKGDVASTRCAATQGLPLRVRSGRRRPGRSCWAGPADPAGRSAPAERTQGPAPWSPPSTTTRPERGGQCARRSPGDPHRPCLPGDRDLFQPRHGQPGPAGLVPRATTLPRHHSQLHCCVASRTRRQATCAQSRNWAPAIQEGRNEHHDRGRPRRRAPSRSIDFRAAARQRASACAVVHPRTHPERPSRGGLRRNRDARPRRR